MTAIDNEWRDVERALDELLSAPENSHAKILHDLRVKNSRLAERVEKLFRLAHSDAALPQSVDAAAPDLFAAMAEVDALEHVGEIIGSYRIVELIQRGGMGAVYRGERADGAFEQSVAIKLVPASIDSESARAMFDRERRNLVKLEHPNIARIIDAGVTVGELPYYVMEFIDGAPIDQFTSELSSRKEILRLFVQLCDALAYCHRSMIVHGDIKPANVFVADGRVRLLDFGIGRLIEDTVRPETLKKMYAYSPGYAAPEQQSGQAIEISSDIYSLGALLNRLLQPIKATRMPADLTAIIEKCMSRDPADRYASVEALHNDIEAYLSYLPVRARAAPPLYRAKKFVRRNAVLVGATGGIIASLVAGLAVALWQFEAARAEAQRSKQVTSFLTSLFERADPGVAGEQDVALSDIVNDAAIRLETELDGLPDVRNEVKRLIGTAYYGVGEFEKSFKLHQEALTYWLENVKPPHVEIVRALNALGIDYRERGEYQMAVKLHREAIAQLAALKQKNSIDAWDSWTKLGYALKEIDAEGGTKAFQQAHSINLNTRPNDKHAIARSLGQIAAGYRAENNIELSIRHGEEALEIAQENGENLAPDIISIRCALALDYGKSGIFEKAHAAQRQCIDETTERLGVRHPWKVWYLNNLGALDLRMGRLAEAELSYREAIAIADEKLPPMSIGRLAAEINSAVVLWQSGRTDQAAHNLNNILQRMEQSFGAKHASSGRVRSLLGRVKLEQGDAVSAARFIENSLDGLTGVWRSDAQLWLSEAKLTLGDSDAAAAFARESLAARQSNPQFTEWQRAEAEYVLAAATADRIGMLAATEIFNKTLPENHFRRR